MDMVDMQVGCDGAVTPVTYKYNDGTPRDAAQRKIW